MGKNYSRLVPNYFRNFNIEKRVSRQMDKLETEKVLEISPRHPSTVETLKKFEESAPTVQKEDYMLIIEKSKSININAEKVKVTDKRVLSDQVDKRPKKENESRLNNESGVDIDFRVYGYSKPDKIQRGHLTLRQFDEFINEYRDKSTSETIKNASTKLFISEEDLQTMIQFYKPLYVLNKNSPKDGKENDLELTEAFPNMKKIA